MLLGCLASQDIQSDVTSVGWGVVASEPHPIFDSERGGELARLVLSCDFDFSCFDAYVEGNVILTDQSVERASALTSTCSIEAFMYADFAGACADAVGQRKITAAAGASANMIEEPKTMEAIGEVAAISIASATRAAVIVFELYDATPHLDRSQQ